MKVRGVAESDREAPKAPRFIDREAPKAPRFIDREAPKAPRFIDRTLDRALVVPLSPCAAGGRRRPLWIASPLYCLLLLLCCGSLLLGYGSPLLVLLLGLLSVGATAHLLLYHDYRYTLRIERGRIFLLRNDVPIFDASVLAGTGSERQQILLGDDRIEAVRCRRGEAPSYVFGIPLLRAAPQELGRIRGRLEKEVAALETLPRQLELLDDADVQAHLLGRLRSEGRLSGLHAELVRLAQGGSSRAAAAQALLLSGHLPAREASPGGRLLA